METEEQVDLELEEQPQGADTNNRALTRNKQLADKYAASEADKARLAAEKAESDKERDFYKGFNTMASKYQGAADHQDKILEKVKAGYDIEDATVAVLSREGKLGAPAEQPGVTQAPIAQPSSPAGGSASFSPPINPDRKPSEMNLDELRSALVEAERKGDIGLNR